jgi:NADPH:quinone reductase-like Zn-dependent oxidoreductase
MQAIMVDQAGGPEVMQILQTAMPQPGPGEVLVRVLAAGVGPWDIHLRGGGWTGQYPYIPGGEFAGVVVGDTGDHAGFQDGEPVYGYPGLAGCYAQYLVCQAEQMAPMPSGLSPADAAAVPVDGLTAEQGLMEVLGLGAESAGEKVLITAGAGGMGHLAVQIARALGAVVIATASPQHHEFVHKLGAAVVIDHTRPDWPDQVRETTDGGVDRVLATVTPSLEGAARAARDGALIATPVHSPAFPHADRVQWRQFNGQPRGSGLIRLAPWFGDGTLSVEVSRWFSWQDAAEAHREVARGHTRGKLVLIVDDDYAAELGV